MRSRNCKQIWRALRLVISVAFQILIKMFQIEDILKSLPGGEWTTRQSAKFIILPFVISV